MNGTVTYAGKPVPEGFITFYPVDRHGSNCGSEIRDGRYTVRAVAPGKKCVRIVTRPRPELIENERTGERSFRLLCPQLFVPSGAAGNDQLVEITPGSQTLDFALQPPGRR